MSVNVIDTLKPKNGGSFPVVEAVDVAVSGSTRLNTALDAKANTSDLATVAASVAGKADASEVLELRNAIAGKANQSSIDSLNTIVATKASQASVDSLNAIVSTKAEEKDLDYIYAAIDKKADNTKVDGLESRVDQKANIETLNNTTKNLQNQIDQIEINATSEAAVAPEVVAARVGQDGTSYGTLKTRIDTEVGALKSRVNEVAVWHTTARDQLEDLNDVKQTCKIMLVITEASVPDNLPSDYPLTGTTGILDVFKASYSSYYTVIQHITLCNNSAFGWVRGYNSQTATWENWRKENVGTFAIKDKVVFSSNARTVLSNLNNAEVDTKYMLMITNASVPDNLPSDFVTNGGYCTLETTKAVYSGNNYVIEQIIESPLLQYFWWRTYNSADGEWSEWLKKYYYTPNTLTIKVGAGQTYTRLRDGIAEAVKTKGSTVIVYPGTYDLTSEFATEIAAATGGQTGIALGNDVTVKFMSGAYVTALFDNSSSWVYNYFSPFYSSGNFTLENANIKASNTRYCVHDEMSGSGTYYAKYINCNMEYANTHTDVNYVQCIGGGLGEHAYITIEGGQYKSSTTVGISSYGTYGTPENCQECISYHNGRVATCDSKIVVKDVYLKDRGYMRFSCYGESTIKSPVEVNNCSEGLPIMFTYETNTYHNINYDIVAYNNTVRNDTVEFQFEKLIDLIED
jgi:hypothetical protein